MNKIAAMYYFLFIFIYLFHFSKEQIHHKINWNKLRVTNSAITINLLNFRMFWTEKPLHNIPQNKEGNNYWNIILVNERMSPNTSDRYKFAV